MQGDARASGGAPGAATEKVRKAARLSCRACRISKVKCDLETCTPCTRCTRIGTQCIPNAPSMRGRHNSTTRLGPSMRALLHTGTPSPSGSAGDADALRVPARAAPSGSSDDPDSLGIGGENSVQLYRTIGRSTEASRQVRRPHAPARAWRERLRPALTPRLRALRPHRPSPRQLSSALHYWSSFRDALLATGSETSKLFFVRTSFLTAVRHKSLGARSRARAAPARSALLTRRTPPRRLCSRPADHMTLVMRQAHELQLPFDKTMHIFSEHARPAARGGGGASSTLAADAASAAVLPPMPFYIAEWLSLPLPAIVRLNAYGRLRWIPNAVMQGYFASTAAGEQMMAMLSAETAMAAAQAKAGADPNAPMSGRDGMEVQLALDMAWSKAYEPLERRNFFAFVTSMWSQVDLGGGKPAFLQSDSPGTYSPNLAGVRYGPYRLSSRIAAFEHGAVTWEAYLYTPCGLTVLPQAGGGGLGARAPPLGGPLPPQAAGLASGAAQVAAAQQGSGSGSSDQSALASAGSCAQPVRAEPSSDEACAEAEGELPICDGTSLLHSVEIAQLLAAL